MIKIAYKKSKADANCIGFWCLFWIVKRGNGMDIKENISENMQKHFNYKEQFKRLNKAIDNNFYLEAIFIEYAIIEDRAESILLYENNEIKSDSFVSIDRKLNKIIKLAENKKSLPHRYFSDGIINEILEWKECRNQMIHALMKQHLTTQALEELALRGEHLAKEICKRSTNYKRAAKRNNLQESSAKKLLNIFI